VGTSRGGLTSSDSPFTLAAITPSVNFMNAALFGTFIHDRNYFGFGENGGLDSILGSWLLGEPLNREECGEHCENQNDCQFLSFILLGYSSSSVILQMHTDSSQHPLPGIAARSDRVASPFAHECLQKLRDCIGCVGEINAAAIDRWALPAHVTHKKFVLPVVRLNDTDEIPLTDLESVLSFRMKVHSNAPLLPQGHAACHISFGLHSAQHGSATPLSRIIAPFLPLPPEAFIAG
jgi:hypothetical protein